MLQEKQEQWCSNVALRPMILALRPDERVDTVPPLTALEEAANLQQPQSPPSPYEEVTQAARK